MNVTARLAWNSIVAWGSSLAGGVGGFLLVRYLIARLGIGEYGVTGLLDSLVVFAMLSDLGIRGALDRHLTEHMARGDHRRMNELLSIAALCYVGIAAALTLVCWLCAEPLVQLFKIGGAEHATALWLVRLFVPAYTLTTFVGTSFRAVIESRHRFDISDEIHTAEIIVRLLLIVAFIEMGWGLVGWAAGYLIAKMLAAVVCAVVAWRLEPAIAIGRGYLNWSVSGELFGLGSWMLLYQTVFRLNAQTDPFILASFMGPIAVGFYKPAFWLMAAAQPFAGVLNRQLRPLATNYFVQNRRDLLGELLIRGTRTSFVLSLPFVVVFTLFAHPLVALWLNDAQFGVTAWLLILWSLADLPANIGNAQFFVMLGMNRVRYLVTVQTIAALVNVAASIALVAWLVARGASTNTCILAIIVPTLIVAWIQRLVVSMHVAREIGLGLGRYFYHGYLPPLVVGACLALVGVVVRWALPHATWPSLVLSVLLVGLAWLPMTWWLGFDDEDRHRVRRLVSRRRQRRAAGDEVMREDEALQGTLD